MTVFVEEIEFVNTSTTYFNCGSIFLWRTVFCSTMFKNMAQMVVLSWKLMEISILQSHLNQSTSCGIAQFFTYRYWNIKRWVQICYAITVVIMTQCYEVSSRIITGKCASFLGAIFLIIYFCPWQVSDSYTCNQQPMAIKRVTPIPATNMQSVRSPCICLQY